MIRHLVGLLILAAAALAGATGMAWDSPRIERYPEQFGPFTLGPEPGQRVTVVAVYQRLLDAKEFWRATTLEYWSIQNESRAILVRGRESTKTQPPGEFAEAKGIAAHLLEGRGRPMLLLVFGVVPSGPSSGITYRVYGFDKRGAFREALTLEPFGDGVMNPIDAKTGKIVLAEGRYLDVSESLGSFAMRVRYEYDEASHRFAASNSCSPVLHPRLTRESAPARAERVLLYESPKAGSPRRTVELTERSRVKFLEACTARFGPSKTSDLWLRVDVDGVTGWTVESEFPKLGLESGG